MRTLTTLAALLFSTTMAAETVAQTPAPPPAGQSAPPMRESQPVPREEKTIEGQVGSVDDSRTEITLTDGTKLRTPPGVALRPGALTEGMTVVARYREEGGANVLTALALKDGGPGQPPRR